MGLMRLSQPTPQVSPQATVMDAVNCMLEHRVGAIAVTHERKIVGLFTERDLMIRVVGRHRDPVTTVVSEVMTAHVFTVPDETSVARATALMRDNHFRHLPIVDEHGELLGMVALRYLLYDLVEDLDAKVGDLQGYLLADSRGG